MSGDNRETASILTIPEELRRMIYLYLFQSQHSIKVEPAMFGGRLGFDGPPDDDGSLVNYFRMPAHSHPLSAQLLRANKVFMREGTSVLYSINTFDCTTRDGVRLLSSSLNVDGFTQLTSIVLDWHQLLDFSFQLAKPEFVEKTRNLSEISLAYWRTRILGGSSMLWASVKSNESTVIRAALAICEKSKKLKYVAQHGWVQRSRPSKSCIIVPLHARGPSGTTTRVKWRFLAHDSQMWPTERKVDLLAELERLESHAVRNAPNVMAPHA
jgi:hypothetical protein